MAGDFGLVYPLWNHTRAADSLLDRVVGEIGIDHLTVPAVTGPQTQFRLSGGFESPYFHTEGGWHYPPQAKLYTASGVKPRVAKWCGTRDVLAELREKAAKLGVSLVLRVELPLMPGIADDALQLRSRSAWGELPSFEPCICNPGFRESIHAAFNDLARYQPAGFELAGVSLEPWQLSFRITSLSQLTQLGDPSGLCFCAACRQVASVAGVDSEEAARTVRARAEWLINCSPPQLAAAGTLTPDNRLRAYRAALIDDCRKWLESLAETHENRMMHLIDSRAGVPGREVVTELSGRRWTSLARLFREALPLYLSILDGKTKSLSQCIPGLMGHKGVEFPVWNPQGPGPDGLVRLMSAAVDEGIEFFDFQGVDEAPPGVITWLKQAVRYARRG